MKEMVYRKGNMPDRIFRLFKNLTKMSCEDTEVYECVNVEEWGRKVSSEGGLATVPVIDKVTNHYYFAAFGTKDRLPVDSVLYHLTVPTNNVLIFVEVEETEFFYIQKTAKLVNGDNYSEANITEI